MGESAFHSALVCRSTDGSKTEVGHKRKQKGIEMKTSELQTILGYLNIGLAVAHNTGVSVGHFGSTDFIELAQSVNSLLLNAITPAAKAN
jgi:hypothetical protein